MANPSHVDALECSLSGSMKRIFSPQRFFIPLETALAYPPPITVELVIGYAHAAWVMLVSTHTTAPEPSVMVGMPGYLAWPLLLAGGVGPLMHDSYEGSAAVQR